MPLINFLNFEDRRISLVSLRNAVLMAAISFQLFHVSNLLAEVSAPSPSLPNAAGPAIEGSVRQIEQEYRRIFGFTGEIDYGIVFLPPAEFDEFAGTADRPFAALYSKGQLYFKNGNSRPVAYRTLRHELAHVVISKISRKRPPAWLDEGLAQYLEGIPFGEQNQMAETIKIAEEDGQLFRLHELEDGFGNLPPALMRVAYAQAFFAARKLVYDGGFSKLREYLASDGTSEAFARTFGFTLAEIESQTFENLKLAEISPVMKPVAVFKPPVADVISIVNVRNENITYP